MTLCLINFFQIRSFHSKIELKNKVVSYNIKDIVFYNAEEDMWYYLFIFLFGHKSYNPTNHPFELWTIQWVNISCFRQAWNDAQTWRIRCKFDILTLKRICRKFDSTRSCFHRMYLFQYILNDSIHYFPIVNIHMISNIIIRDFFSVWTTAFWLKQDSWWVT